MNDKLRQARAWLGRNKRRVKRTVTVVFVCVVVALLVRVGMTIEWSEVAQAMLETPNPALWKAGLLVLASYCVYACFDLLGKWYTGHDLPWWRTMLAGSVSYAFTMNFGAAVGGLALRLRLYAKQGLNPGQIMRIMGLSMTTNWIGYCLLGGTIFAMGAVRPPSSWEIGAGPLRMLGAVMICVALGYVALCAFSERRSWTIRDHTVELPELRIALLQLALAMTNWSLMGLIVYTVMPGDVSYATVLGTLLIGSLIGAIAHIPGGLGVTEYVFITLLSDAPRHQVLGAILVYRALYYVAPVLLTGACYLVYEARSRSSGVARGTRIA
jgi:uncharacterized membrane protein YbhN (UPF0104 family)